MENLYDAGEKMKLLAIVFSLLYLNISLSEEFTEEDRKYLSDLPAPTSENLRWILPADAWIHKKTYLKKGKFYKISSYHNLDVYKTSALKGEPIYVVKEGTIYEGSHNVCGDTTYQLKDINYSEIFECVDSSCHRLNLTEISSTELQKKKIKSLGIEYWNAENMLNFEKYTKCTAKIDDVISYYVWDRNRDSIYDFVSRATRDSMKPNIYLRTVGIDKDKNYVEVLINDKKYYVDIRECKEHPENCNEVDIKFSDYEKDWIRLKKHQEKKDLYGMNYLIKNLKPCVEKKDKVCIKKFFPDPVKHSYLPDSYMGYEIPSIEVNDELVKELEACLDYKNLLPHLMASRGINKACIFNYRDRVDKIDESEIMLLNVTYPEAVRISWGTEIYMVPEKK